MNKAVVVILIILVLAAGTVGVLFAMGIIGGNHDTGVCVDGHTWEEVVDKTKVEPTCQKEGSATYKCRVCGEEKTETLPKKPHNTSTIFPSDPTCTTPGKKIGEMCVNRGCDYRTGGEDIPPLGHIEVSTPAKEPNCTEMGYSGDGTHCATCMEVLVEPSEKIPATGHTPVDAGEIPATCAAPGSKGGTVCQDCGRRLTDPDEIYEQLEEHSAELVVKNHATCTSDGYLECPVCHATEKFEDRNPDLHNFSEIVTPAVAPNCATKTNGATAVMMCSNPGCGLEVGGVEIKWETLHEYGHEDCIIEWTVEFEATETSAGRANGVCPDCGETFSVDIPPISDGSFEDDNNIYDEDKVPTQKRKKRAA